MKKTAKTWLSLCLSVIAISAIPFSVALAFNRDIDHNTDQSVPQEPQRPEVNASEYPAFLNETDKGPLINVNVKNLLQLELRDIEDNPNISVGINSLTLDKLDKLLSFNLTNYPAEQNSWFYYLKHDINSYFLKMYVANDRVFSIYGKPTRFWRFGPDPLKDSYITGELVFKNITNFAANLKDANGVPYPEMLPIQSGESVTIKYTSKIDYKNSPIHAKLDKNASGQLYLGWRMDKFQMVVGDQTNYASHKAYPNVFTYKDFAFYDHTSALNIKMNHVSEGIDPYSAAKQLSGYDRRFNQELINRYQVSTDVKNLFEDTFDVTKQSAKFVNRLLTSLASEHNYNMADIIAKHSYDIADLVEAFFPEIAHLDANNLSLKNLIIDLLRSYKSSNFNESVSNLYEIIYKYKQLIIDLLSDQLSFFGNINEVIDTVLGDAYSPTEFFERLRAFLPQIESLLTDANQPELLKLVTNLLHTEQTYLLNFLTDKENVTIIVDLLINVYNDKQQNNPEINKFLNAYKSVFVELLTSAQQALDYFVEKLLDNNQKMLIDILNLASINVSQFSPQAQNLFDFFIKHNEVFSDTNVAKKTIKNFFREIANLFNDQNLAKVTLRPLSQNWQQQYSMHFDHTFWFIDNLAVKYQISANGFNVKNSLINSILDFLPNQHLSKAIDYFVTDEIKNDLSNQAKHEIDKYIAKQWYAPFVPPNTSKNIAFGPNWDGRNGIIDTIINRIKNNLPQKASLRTVAKEVFFGNDVANLNNDWMVVNGNVDISYSGRRIYVLPLFERSLDGKMYMNYQLINANQKINARDVANKSQVMINTASPQIVPTIPMYNLSVQLHQSFRNLVKNFVNYTINREYDSQNNIYLRPIKDRAIRSKFALNASKADENIDQYLYVKDYWVTKSNLLLQSNFEATKQKIMRDNWKYRNNAPALNNIALNMIESFMDLSDQLKGFKPLITHSINIYGSGLTSLNAYIEEKVYIGTFLNIWSTYGINLSLKYEFRFLDYSLILPYPVIAKNDPIGMTNRFNVSFTDATIAQEFVM